MGYLFMSFQTITLMQYIVFTNSLNKITLCFIQLCIQLSETIGMAPTPLKFEQAIGAPPSDAERITE